MTLTTERLKWLHDAATELSATKLKMTMKPDELLILTSELLASREAQPVGYNQVQRDMMKDILVRKLGGNLLGEKLCMDDIHAATMELIKAGFRLYTAPPAPAVPDDTRRMDWLVAHHVAVRKPLLYGSKAMFTAQTITDEEDDYHATTLREQIDAAMLAAAPTQGENNE